MNKLVVGIVLWAGTASAETLHVASNGNDSAAGSEAAPWKTIQHAADRVAPGDTVIVHAGTYAGFRVAARGNEAAPIAFVAEGDVRIDGVITSERDGIFIDGASHVRIEGFSVEKAARAGISALDCDHITIVGNKSDANGTWGIFTAFCDDVTIEDNETTRSQTQHGIYTSNSADRPIIRGNLIVGNAQCGIHMNGDVNFGGDGVISGAIVENNVIRDNGREGGSGINGDGVQGALIRNNVVDGNHASGVSLYRIDGGAPSTGNRVVNNTIRMASDARWAINIQDGSTGNIVRNNILMNATPGNGAIDICASCMTNTVSDHNAVVGRFSIDGDVVDLAGWRTRTNQDAASFTTTDGELFVDAAGGNLELRDGSPAIDRGVADDAPATDALGHTRRGAVDIGAFEFGGEAPGDDEGGDGGCNVGGGASGLFALALLGLLRRRR